MDWSYLSNNNPTSPGYGRLSSPLDARHLTESESLSEQISEEEKSSKVDGSDSDTIQHEPIRPPQRPDRAALRRMATQFSKASFVPDASLKQSTTLEKVGTLDGLEIGDSVLDPESEQFDEYKWIRFLVQSSTDQGLKMRKVGFAFKRLNVTGSSSTLTTQSTVGSLFLSILRVGEMFRKKPEKTILHELDGVVRSGEMLLVLGRPGAGCSTFLKTITGELAGLHIKKGSEVHYDGINQQTMLKEFKGEVVYNQEMDVHFPHLTVGQTLEFAAAVRTPQHRIFGISRKEWIKNFAAVVMAVYGISHTKNTKVGNDFVRGVSGGERKRVSIAEMSLAGAPIQCWDNSTRGLDAASALDFVQALRLAAKVGGPAIAVSVYQASQAIYDVFDKVMVLYEGRQIYFGPAIEALPYFEDMGWEKPQRQTVADFLTAITNPSERKPREGMEGRVPRTPTEFERYWQDSPNYAELLEQIGQYEKQLKVEGNAGEKLAAAKQDAQAQHVRKGSPYFISIPMQIRYCFVRSYQRLVNDKTATVAMVLSQVLLGLIVGSIFAETPTNTSSFFSKGSVLFFAILLNALITLGEINALYQQRPVVEKQKSYAFYHPWTEALAGVLTDIPVKISIAVVFNLIIYFLGQLRREPSQFFEFFLFSFIATLTMSGAFRTLAACTKTSAQALAMAGVIILVLVIYTGFVVVPQQMVVWFSWLRWLNPVYYAFEAIVANEFHGRDFPCAQIVPPYPGVNGTQFVCSSTKGARAGETFVRGDAFIKESYGYTYSNVWRNLGILFAFAMALQFTYLVATELNSSTTSSANVLIFRRGKVPASVDSQEKSTDAEKSGEAGVATEQRESEIRTDLAQKDTFMFRNVCLDIPTRDGQRRLLNEVSGWVKPGTLTALMGVSGAGKTTLLDTLAQRVSIGVINGDMLVNGKRLDTAFQRRTGYVQQQDLHVDTSTVREALQFSAMLRQPNSVSKTGKSKHCEEIINMLGMQEYAEAVVGDAGSGLNVEQRKLLSIGVELAAKPDLLLFLDEPTSGLDSQSSWAIIQFLRKLANSGQAVLSTIHQPSAVLFQEFDRLLLLGKGGNTAYFGDIGEQSRTMIDYFEANGGRKCDDAENPAEYMFELVGAGASGKAAQDWSSIWRDSQQAKEVQSELDRMIKDSPQTHAGKDDGKVTEFAMPLGAQLYYVLERIFQQYWRTPGYVMGKFVLGIASGLFIGFSFFQPDTSQQGMQELIFSIFMVATTFTPYVQQIQPRFVSSRALYEARERPSKTYSWVCFILSQILVELPYQLLLGVVVWATFYFPVFGVQSHERNGLVLLFVIQFFLFASTFGQLTVAAMPDSESAGNIATLMFSMMLSFNGVMQPPNLLPQFWIFMYRVSPLTYWVAGIAGTAMHERPVECAQTELSMFDAPAGLSCGEYMREFFAAGAPGRIVNSDAREGCAYCPLTVADEFLTTSGIEWGQRWRNFGLVWVYIGFNIVGAITLYYLFRVRKFNLTGLFKRSGK